MKVDEKLSLRTEFREVQIHNIIFHLFLIQLIVSRVILESGLCTLPANNTLWDAVRLSPHHNHVDDEQVKTFLY